MIYSKLNVLKSRLIPKIGDFNNTYKALLYAQDHHDKIEVHNTYRPTLKNSYLVKLRLDINIIFQWNFNTRDESKTKKKTTTIILIVLMTYCSGGTLGFYQKELIQEIWYKEERTKRTEILGTTYKEFEIFCSIFP